MPLLVLASLCLLELSLSLSLSLSHSHSHSHSLSQDKNYGVISLSNNNYFFVSGQKAVKVSKDVNVSSLPKTMYFKNVPVANANLPDSFVSYFKNKVKYLTDSSCFDLI